MSKDVSLQGYSVRPASADDLDSILELEQKSYPKPWTREAFEEELKKPYSHFWVFTDDETDSSIAGYIVFWSHFDETHILNVVVHLDFRGLGIGTYLVRKALDYSIKKQLKRMFLEVRKSNQGALHMYQKIGFFIDHVKKSFYEDGEDAYFLVLLLDQKNSF